MILLILASNRNRDYDFSKLFLANGYRQLNDLAISAPPGHHILTKNIYFLTRSRFRDPLLSFFSNNCNYNYNHIYKINSKNHLIVITFEIKVPLIFSLVQLFIKKKLYLKSCSNNFYQKL